MTDQYSYDLRAVPGCKTSFFMPGTTDSIMSMRTGSHDGLSWMTECERVADALGIPSLEHHGTGATEYIVSSVTRPLRGLLGERAVIWITTDFSPAHAICTLIVTLYIASLYIPQVLHIEGFDATYLAWEELRATTGDEPMGDGEAQAAWRKIARRMTREWRNKRVSSLR